MADEVLTNTSNTTTEAENVPVWAAALLLTLCLPVMFLAIFGNLLVLISFIKFRKILSVYSIFALFLCITDLTVGLIGFPMFIWDDLSHSLTNTTDPQTFPGGNEAICIIVYVLIDFVPVLLSEVTLFLMATERTLAIFLPEKYQRVKIRHAVMIGLLSWTAVILLYVIDVIVNHFTNEDEIHHGCGRSYLSEGVFTFTIIFGAVLLILSWILYLAILIRIRRNKKLGTQMQDSRRGNVTKMTVVILCAFTVCWLPILAVGASHLNGAVWPYNFIIYFARFLVYSNSSINPFVYNKASEEFRHAFRKILRIEPPTPQATEASKTEYVQDTTEL